MELSYENKMNLAFDKPLEYKGLYIYPATLPYYSIFINADEFLDITRLDEKDIGLLRLSYLGYMYIKSLNDINFKNKWDMLIYVLNIVFKNQPFDIIKENDKLCLKVYQKTNEFEIMNKEYEGLKDQILQNYKVYNNLENQETKELISKLNILKEKMYTCISINETEFDDLRQLIMIQNDIKSEHYSEKVEKMLYETKQKMNMINKDKNNIDFEDLITVVSYSMHINPNEMYDMTIRRFNRYLEIIQSKDDYYLYKELELGGKIEMKSELSYWIKHYSPRGKYDDVLIKNSSLLSSVNSDGKI